MRNCEEQVEVGLWVVLQKLAEEINFLLQVSGPHADAVPIPVHSNTLEHPHGIALKSELSWASLTTVRQCKETTRC